MTCCRGGWRSICKDDSRLGLVGGLSRFGRAVGDVLDWYLVVVVVLQPAPRAIAGSRSLGRPGLAGAPGGGGPDRGGRPGEAAA